MILQALYEYYTAMAAQGKMARRGWSPAKVSFALLIDEQGTLLDVLRLKEKELRGKKEVEVPRVMQLPKPVTRTVGIKANFLCDNASYFLGVDGKGNDERAQKCFQASAELHCKMLQSLDHPAARAVCAYFANWKPGTAREHPALQPYLEEILTVAPLFFGIRENLSMKNRKSPGFGTLLKRKKTAKKKGAASSQAKRFPSHDCIQPSKG